MLTKENPIETQLAVVPKGDGDLTVSNSQQAAMAAIFGNLIGRELHNFTGSPRDLWAFKALCCGPLAEPLHETAGEVIEIRYYYGMLYEHVDEKTGEMEDRLRFVIVTPDMKAYKTASFYVAREIGRAVNTFGNTKFDPPLRMKWVEGKGQGTRKFYTLSPVFD